MSRLFHVFNQLKKHNKKAFIPFLPAGFPHAYLSVALMHAAVKAGADVIELGVPFSDPVADGPVIQAAYEHALKQNFFLPDIFNNVKEFRKQNDTTPIVLMSYLNPIEIMGYKLFIDQAKAAGVDGVLIVDMPPEESDDFLPLLKKQEMDPIFLISPTTTPARSKMIAANASGFLYYVSLKGVTGAKHLDYAEINKRVQQLRTFTSLPIVVGFGVNTPESAGKIADFADGIIVGSALVSEIDRYQNETMLVSHIINWLTQLRYAIDKKTLD